MQKSVLCIIFACGFLMAISADECVENVVAEALTDLSSKSPYSPTISLASAAEKLPKGVKTRAMAFLGRHASRYATDNETCVATEKLVNDTFLKHWKCKSSETADRSDAETLRAIRQELENYGSITIQGQEEAFGLGKRVADLLSVLVEREGAETRKIAIKRILTTAKKRTQQTARHFLKGLLSQDTYHKLDFVPLDDDQELRFFDVCDRYNALWKSVGKNNPEIKKAEKMLLEPLAQKLSAQMGKEISLKDVETLYKECVFKWHVEEPKNRREVDKQLCDLFTREELNAVSFYKDLKEYYKKGPGAHSVGGIAIACGLLHTMLEDLSVGGIGAAGEFPAYLRFAHAETLVPLMTLLNLATHHAPLTVEHSRAEARWSLRDVCPMACNLMFLTVDTPDGDAVVQIINEVVTPWKIKPCEGHVLCDLDLLLDFFPRESCRWSDMCSETADDL
ncbi:putative multiple inositol polyphosphate phosphatase 1-like [Diplonema papillatum]|nr:putative multiple inositol polyphosphate phosphatase 1-like [Diplonema papillatum]